MTLYMDYTSPSARFFFDVNKSPEMKKDDRNFFNVLGVEQLNTLENVSLLDIFLSINNIIEPHYHQNAAELIYCISGAAAISFLNPFTKQMQDFTITPGQVVNIPQGWWHYEVATMDNTHLLAIFNAPTPEVILGSDLLKLTPPNIMAKTYCMDENQWKNIVAPVQPAMFIGPPTNCKRDQNNYVRQSPAYNNQWYTPQPYSPSYYYYHY